MHEWKPFSCSPRSHRNASVKKKSDWELGRPLPPTKQPKPVLSPNSNHRRADGIDGCDAPMDSLDRRLSPVEEVGWTRLACWRGRRSWPPKRFEACWWSCVVVSGQGGVGDVGTWSQGGVMIGQLSAGFDRASEWVVIGRLSQRLILRQTWCSKSSRDETAAWGMGEPVLWHRIVWANLKLRDRDAGAGSITSRPRTNATEY